MNSQHEHSESAHAGGGSAAGTHSTDDGILRPDVVSVLELLVRTPSVNPLLDPASAGEGEIALVIRDWCAARGIEAWLEEVAPGRPNVIARVGTGTGPVLVLCAHLDTVSAEGMAEPFDACVTEERIHGRGS
jgi:acetylornithine deacetylase